MNALLSVEGLAVDIGRERPLVDVALDVRPGEAVGLVGETGSGKSLTCKAIIGMLPRPRGRVVAGRIEFDGRDIGGLSTKQWAQVRGREIGYVPQASLGSLDPVMKVGPQLVESIRILTPDVEPRQRALELLSQVQMPNPIEVLRQYPHELSGGMRQRVMIALALVGEPRLLLADEPTTALDVTVQKGILDLLSGLCANTGMALVLVTHDLAVVRTVCQSVAVMYGGRTVERGPVEALDARPSHPYTQSLLEADLSHARRGHMLKTLPVDNGGRRPADSACQFAPRCPEHEASCWVEPVRRSSAGNPDQFTECGPRAKERR